MEEFEKCIHLTCKNQPIGRGWRYCKEHQDGGYLGDGSAYDQYQIIEQDFIDFIQVVPLDDNDHFKVHSPVLRDIILRACVQIEIFFKEWAKYACDEDQTPELFKKYYELKKGDEIKGERNWNFGCYFDFRKEFNDYNIIFVRHLNQAISPFKSWASRKTPPKWWQAYNSIKHNGHESTKQANLENALYSLSALFLMHCTNRYSREYLNQFKETTVSSFVDTVKVKFHPISSPLDTKRYLFRENPLGSDKEIQLVSMKKFNDRDKRGRI
jgi:hypothetical protein